MVFYRIQSASRGEALYGFGIWSQPAYIFSFLVWWVALLTLFNHVPEIDQTVSALFFVPAQCTAADTTPVCGNFPLASVDLLKLLRRIFHILPMAAAAIVIAVALRDLVFGLSWNHERIRISAISLVTLAIGPGLIVNGILKEFIGRPRPDNSWIFGGDHPFVAAGEMSGACQHNCSFVSGEAASIAWLICLLPFWPRGQRRGAFRFIAAIIIITDIMRVAFGRHYLSDVILGSLSTIIVYSIVAGLCETWLSSRHISQALPDE